MWFKRRDIDLVSDQIPYFTPSRLISIILFGRVTDLLGYIEKKIDRLVL